MSRNMEITKFNAQQFIANIWQFMLESKEDDPKPRYKPQHVCTREIKVDTVGADAPEGGTRAARRREHDAQSAGDGGNIWKNRRP